MFFGIREHGMAAVMNGLAQHGGTLPVGGTFFVFSDYARPAIRMAALMGSHVIYSFTHDSVAVGEDGPTHQPVEHLASLRAMPGLLVVRPADANETAQAWALAVAHDGPVMLVLSRQDLPVLEGTADGDLARGAYVLHDPPHAAVTLIGTGSEVAVCLDAAQGPLAADGIAARVVSMPSWERFAAQDAAYRESVLSTTCPGCRSRPVPPSVGSAGPTPRSASTGSAPAHPVVRCSPSWASTPTTWPPRPAPSSAAESGPPPRRHPWAS